MHQLTLVLLLNHQNILTEAITELLNNDLSALRRLIRFQSSFGGAGLLVYLLAGRYQVERYLVFEVIVPVLGGLSLLLVEGVFNALQTLSILPLMPALRLQATLENLINAHFTNPVSRVVDVYFWLPYLLFFQLFLISTIFSRPAPPHLLFRKPLPLRLPLLVVVLRDPRNIIPFLFLKGNIILHQFDWLFL